ncbi:MAG: TatD family hydrolase [Myxococcota bacterium]
MIDAHCHLDAAEFDADRDAALERARAVGVRAFVLAGVDPEGWLRQSALARAHRDVYAGYGIHPWTAAAAPDGATDDLMAALGDALDSPHLERPVALGEMGLDRSPRVPKDSATRQETLFRAQLALARERELPVILHIVRAHGRALEILAADGLPRAAGQVHAYSGSAELVPRYVALGLSLSFGAAVTRPACARAARAVPPERLLVETDAPDQPPPARAKTRNEPAFIDEIVAALAAARGAAPADLAALTERNARALFALGASRA